ncbi:MAG: pilus (MSHA type) biogenesis protein MshL [Desulfobulbaceae bacterium]|nr:pilus (MSHA type) biogenesis protein MshL [Desulfobulbaceae bacterium]
MHRNISFFIFCITLPVLLSLAGCGGKKHNSSDEVAQEEQPTMEMITEESNGNSYNDRETNTQASPHQLPVRYQQMTYFAEQTDDALNQTKESYAIKVGANISSTKGPQPLWDIMKRLANLKEMNVSWASDVDQNVLVDVNINADDNYFEALDNLLRQVDYFHEVVDKTIVVKYKETRQFQIQIPNIKGSYTSSVGGNFLGQKTATTGSEGTVKIISDGNQFNFWDDVDKNLSTLVNAWKTTTVQSQTPDASTSNSGSPNPASTADTTQATRQVASGQPYYILDRSIGLITVTAPRPLLEKVAEYLNTLTEQLYRQVIIEAKIIEVFLKDNSKIGIDWSQVLKDFNVESYLTLGQGGNVYPWVEASPGQSSPTQFVSSVNMRADWLVAMINALEEQGETRVLSNPKITVLNGQPALLSVGKDISYIKEIKSDYNADTGLVSYTATTDSIVEGVALGVVASITSDNSAILHLTPITTDIIGDSIVYEEFGSGLKVGTPSVGIREMSTMVQVKNGEVLVIGGLIDSIDDSKSEMAPLLGRIPLIKYLFGFEEKQKEKRELVILLTPKIVSLQPNVN